MIGYIVEFFEIGSTPAAVALGPDATSYARIGLLPQTSYMSVIITFSKLLYNNRLIFLSRLVVRPLNSVGEGPSAGIRATTTASS